MNKKYPYSSIEQKLLGEEQLDKSRQGSSDKNLDAATYGITTSLSAVSLREVNLNFWFRQTIDSCCTFLSFIKNTFVPPSPYIAAA